MRASGATLKAQTPTIRVKTARQERIRQRRACKQSRDATTARQGNTLQKPETTIPMIAQTAFETRSTRIPRSQAAQIAHPGNIQRKQAKPCVVFVTRASKCQEKSVHASATTAPLAK